MSCFAKEVWAPTSVSHFRNKEDAAETKMKFSSELSRRMDNCKKILLHGSGIGISACFSDLVMRCWLCSMQRLAATGDLGLQRGLGRVCCPLLYHCQLRFPIKRVMVWLAVTTAECHWQR